MRPEVSVIIPARDAAAVIEAPLRGLDRQTAPRERFEVIVVDDHSRDSTGEAARRHPGTRVVRTDAVRGPGGARNRGIAEARGELLAFLDDSCVPDPDYIERGLARFAAEPELTILAARITTLLPSRPNLAQLLDAARYFNQEAYVRNGYAGAGASWVRAGPVREVGGFNERLPHHGGEDLELYRLLTSRGASIAYAPEVHETHPARSRLRDLAAKSYRVGRAAPAIRRNARAPLPGPALLTRPWRVLPRPGVRGIERLRARGVSPGPLTRAALVVCQYLFLQLPISVGEAVGFLRRPPSAES